MATMYLTTVDNPYSPKTEFSEWLAFDLQKGYNSCGLLDRVSKTSDELSDALIADDIQESIQWILDHDTTGKKISDDLGKVDYFFGALGTTGSSRGIIEYLQEQNPELKKIGIISKTGGMIPGIRNEEEMMEVRNIPKRTI